ncbi:hypothetical protein FA740_17860 [Paracoccus hibiscisoli]|uniref:Transposase n=1 Tax=Paracoccus hibiscisoli TaxID=2023261 RepID=A0A4U0QED2_9RHOB|nr:hypothetical protein FA740_17860 [Paracoccus hibiscisoli]
MLHWLLAQISPDQEIASVTADGNYDTRKCLHDITDRGAAARSGEDGAATAAEDVTKRHFIA